MVVACEPVRDLRPFIEANHYSKSINGCKVAYAFSLRLDGVLVGAALFGPLSTTAWKKYGESERDVVELRRLVCLDECPRNTESSFIAKCLKYIKRNSSYKICVSYADPYHGHVGIIYQAANWSYLGQTAADVMLRTPEGRLYHSRALRTKYKGEYKPFVRKLREMKDNGLLSEIAVPGKHVYTYNLNGVHVPNGANPPKQPNK